jgi:hypothetical protein
LMAVRCPYADERAARRTDFGAGLSAASKNSAHLFRIRSSHPQRENDDINGFPCENTDAFL